MITPQLPVPLRVAIVGIGGFGSAHHSVFGELEAHGMARVVATCDPALDGLADVCAKHRFAERGVAIYRTFDEMLAKQAGQLDLGVVAAPIPLHAPMHEALAQNGIACYLEKPPTLDPGELSQMIDLETRVVKPSHVGFAFIHLADRLALKRRMMSGEFGALRRVSFLGLARRGRAYFQRSNWAGKLFVGESLVLDSCMGNALAHFLNNLLFFAGLEKVEQWARPAQMTCELYRANAIEGTDTVFAIGQLVNGVEMRIAASHACGDQDGAIEESFEFEHAQVTIRGTTRVVIQHASGASEEFVIEGASLPGSVRRYCEFLTGQHSRPAQMLEDCRGFVEANALFYLAARGIRSIPASRLQQSADATAVLLPGVGKAARDLIERAVFPSASHAPVPWAGPGGSAVVDMMPRLREVVKELAGRG